MTTKPSEIGDLDGTLTHMFESESPEEIKPYFRVFLDSLGVLNDEKSGRGAVLVAVAMLDDILKRCIKAFLVDGEDIDKLLNGFNAPLSSLSAKILVAYLPGILSKAEQEECHQLRKIRNRFAHDIHVSFSDQEVIDRCGSLSLYVHQNDVTRRYPKEKFQLAAIALVLSLTSRQQHIAERRLKYASWPR